MDKQHAHNLLDRLDPGQLETIGRLLEAMVEPGTSALAGGRPGNEPVTEDEQNDRKRDFLLKLRANLANDDPRRQDQMIEEFRRLVLGG